MNRIAACRLPLTWRIISIEFQLPPIEKLHSDAIISVLDVDL
jgi:hypothetical protein